MPPHVQRAPGQICLRLLIKPTPARPGVNNDSMPGSGTE